MATKNSKIDEGTDLNLVKSFAFALILGLMTWVASGWLLYPLAALALALGATTAFAKFHYGLGPDEAGVRPFRDAWRGLHVRHLRAAYVVSMVAPLTLVLGRWPSVLGWAQVRGGIVGMIAACALLWIGIRRDQQHRAWWMATQQRWTMRLATIFSIAPAVVEQQAVFEEARGGLVVTTVPPAMAMKLAPANRAALEAAVAQVAPHLTLDPMSSEREVWLVPVTAEVSEERAALAGSGGLLGAVIEKSSASLSDGPRLLDLSQEEI